MINLEKIVRYCGLLRKTNNGEENDLLGLMQNNESVILAQLIKDDMDNYGHYISVRYYVSNVNSSFDEISKEFFMKLMGHEHINYGVNYSEITGYLWTDEEIVIGGHDLLNELKGSFGKYLYLEIKYSTEPMIR